MASSDAPAGSAPQARAGSRILRRVARCADGALGVALAAAQPRPTVTAQRLAELNAESAACIARWQIAVAQNDALGRYLVSGTGVPAGEAVMVLPPNLIQSCVRAGARRPRGARAAWR